MTLLYICDTVTKLNISFLITIRRRILQELSIKKSFL